MKISLLAICLIGLTIGLNGQTSVRNPMVTSITVTPDATISADKIQVGGTPSARWVGQNVQIRIGLTVITADEAEIPNWAAGGADSIRTIQLRGNVQLKATVKIE